MALANGIRFIWLDEHIGQEGEYDQFKRMFRTALEPTAAMPPDQIDSLIRALNDEVAPFLFADTIDGAIALIREHRTKKIIFISSGALGRQIIPRIIAEYPQVHSFYIFCAIVANYVQFASAYLSCLQIFDNEIDLLVRLTRDISEDIIRQGKDYLTLTDPRNALKCFDCARTLCDTANTTDTLNPPYFGHLRVLDGSGTRIGLIQQAQDMMNQQRTPPPPSSERGTDQGEQLSQQESQAQGP